MNEMYGYLLLSFGLLFLVWMMINPFIGLALFTVFLYLKPDSFSIFLASIHITRVIAIVTIIVFFLQRRKKGIKLFDASQTKWLIFLLLMMFASMITSIWESNTLDFIMGFLKVILGYFLIINLIDSEKRFNSIIWVMLLTSIYIALMSISTHFSVGAENIGVRMYGYFAGALFSDPNDLALSFIMLIPYAYYGLFQKKSVISKVILIFIIGIFIWGIVLTQSRGGLLGFIVIWAVIWLRSKKKLLLLFFLLITVGVGWHLTPDYYKDRMMSIETATTADESAMIRLNAWHAGLNMMKGNVFGVGAGNFGEGFVLYRPIDAIDPAGRRRAAHNMFVELGGETGFPGLIVYLCLLLSTLLSLQKTKKKNIELDDDKSKNLAFFADATFVSLVGYCASGMFLSQAYNWILFYLIGFSVALKYITAFNEENNEG